MSEPTQTIDKEVLTEALSVKLKLEEVVKKISMLKNTYAATFDEGVSKKLNGEKSENIKPGLIFLKGNRSLAIAHWGSPFIILQGMKEGRSSL